MRTDVRRLFPGVAAGLLALGLLLAGPAGGEETALCPRCEHRFVTDVAGKGTRGKARTPCRVCRVQRAELGLDLYTRAQWAEVRKALRADHYAIGEFGDPRPPRLLPLDTAAALAQALFDEAQRFRRRATWSRRMARELKKGRAMWRKVLKLHGGDASGADWAFDDRVAAFEERAVLHTTLADRYQAQARDLSTDALAGVLPAPGTPVVPDDAIPPRSVAAIVEEMRTALRVLNVLEHQALQRLLGLTRGVESGTQPDATYFEKLRGLWDNAFSTAFLTNVHRDRVRQIDELRSNLLTDARLDRFFDRARTIAKALRRQRKAKHGVDGAPPK